MLLSLLLLMLCGAELLIQNYVTINISDVDKF
ncbi:hypothetical protein CAL7102_02092 [Dulcicalothrix desertica PCC 7102]|nr:hypothetical protein CAL7102_02092 [Dulcicalothrix desertica PCC 7102]